MDKAKVAKELLAAARELAGAEFNPDFERIEQETIETLARTAKHLRKVLMAVSNASEHLQEAFDVFGKSDESHDLLDENVPQQFDRLIKLRAEVTSALASSSRNVRAMQGELRNMENKIRALQ